MLICIWKMNRIFLKSQREVKTKHQIIQLEYMIKEANNSLGLIDIHLCWCIMYNVSLDVSFVYNDRDTLFNTLRPRQNGRHFADDTLYGIFVNENVRISIEFSLKFVPKGPINNIPAVVQIMAWRRPGDKPLSESMLVRSLTHMCITRPQWVKSQKPAINFREVQRWE